MGTKALSKLSERMPSVFDDLFRPWNDLIDNGFVWGRVLTVPAVNIKDNKDDFTVTLAAPGMKKEDFNIDIEGNMITVSCEKEEKKEEKEERYTRKEYNFSSFSRSFTIPDEILRDKIEARYEDGLLKVILPKKEEAKKTLISKHVAVK